MNTIADSLAPEVLEMLGSQFLEELDEWDAVNVVDWYGSDIEDVCGYRTGASLWHSLWLFGIVLEDNVFSSLGNCWQPDGVVANGYYIPDDFDTSIPLVSIDQPPMVAVAWDAK